MRKTRETLRLKWDAGLNMRAIARSCGISHSTVTEALQRAEKAGLSWPLPADMTDAALETLLYPKPRAKQDRPMPDLQQIHRELRKRDVTLRLLWEEYKAQHSDGYQYTQFCELYRQWSKTLDLTMRQVHRAGEKMFVDYAGHTMPVVDPTTGEVREAQIFVAVLGASSYTYAEAAWSQDLPSWIAAHCRAFEYFGGVPQIVVPDNLKSGVSRSCRYEPDINPTYQELASHYGVAIIPARPRKPKDKAKVEAGVQVVERWILAALRNRTFFSLAELNEAIWHALEQLNAKPLQKIGESRYTLYCSLDKPALRPLPSQRFEFAEWKKVRANIDCHVEVDSNYYSVPYQLAGKELEARLTGAIVEVFYDRQRIASHARIYGKGRFSTQEDHLPPRHRHQAEWSPERLIRWGERVGPYTAELVRQIMNSKKAPEQGYRSCLGLFRLAKTFTPERVEAAAKRALACKAYSYRSVYSILEKGLDQTPMETAPEMAPIKHENVRGADYYQQGGGNAC